MLNIETRVYQYRDPIGDPIGLIEAYWHKPDFTFEQVDQHIHSVKETFESACEIAEDEWDAFDVESFLEWYKSTELNVESGIELDRFFVEEL